MTNFNLAPGLAAFALPGSDDDAAALFSECTAGLSCSDRMTGLLGIMFADMVQFRKAANDSGWNADWTPLMACPVGEASVVTRRVRLRKADKEVSLIIHSWGDNVQVINVKTKGDTEEEK